MSRTLKPSRVLPAFALFAAGVGLVAPMTPALSFAQERLAAADIPMAESTAPLRDSAGALPAGSALPGGASAPSAAPSSLVAAPSSLGAAPSSLGAAKDDLQIPTAASVAAALKKEEAAKEAAGKSAGAAAGIELPGAPPTLSSDPAELQRAAEVAAAQAAAEEVRRAQDHNRKSYEKASMGLLPLSADQIREFLQRLENTQGAAQAPLSGPPKGEVKVSNIALDPGVEPPRINLAAGYVTTVDIVDQSGEPWPIMDVGVGGNFEVTPTQAGSHIVRIVPLTRVGQGSLSLVLKDLTTPVIFHLSSGGATFHMRYDARIPKLGPNARTPIIQPRVRAGGGLVAGDQIITMILENAAPKEATRLKVSGLDARTMAWQIGDKVYVRTPLSLLSPAWNASASSADGMTVYEIGDAPVLLLSDNGSMMRAHIMRDEEHDK